MSFAKLTNEMPLGSQLVLVPQCISEAWSVMTRPLEVNGFGLTPSEAASELRRIVAYIPLRFDPLTATPELVDFAERYAVHGRQIHDARLALLVQLHGLDGILTSNPDDFRRYSINVVSVPKLG